MSVISYGQASEAMQVASILFIKVVVKAGPRSRGRELDSSFVGEEHVRSEVLLLPFC